MIPNLRYARDRWASMVRAERLNWAAISFEVVPVAAISATLRSWALSGSASPWDRLAEDPAARCSLRQRQGLGAEVEPAAESRKLGQRLLTGPALLILDEQTSGSELRSARSSRS